MPPREGGCFGHTTARPCLELQLSRFHCTSAARASTILLTTSPPTTRALTGSNNKTNGTTDIPNKTASCTPKISITAKPHVRAPHIPATLGSIEDPLAGQVRAQDVLFLG